MEYKWGKTNEKRAPMTQTRIQSYGEFWTYYQNEHRNPSCRKLHFFGTSMFIAVDIYCLITEPLWFGLASIAAVALTVIFWNLERKRNAFPVLFAILIMTALANPIILFGSLTAYFWAWVGHFMLEKNRPATFQYPLWSLVSDFKMYGQMLLRRPWPEQATNT